MKKKTPTPKAIIFDMDGVIVDSMPYHFIAWYEALRPWGIHINCFEVYLREGEKWQYSLKDILRRSGVKPSPSTLQKIFTDRDKIFKKYYKQNVFDGAKAILEWLKKKNYLLGLVTGTPSSEMRRILAPGIRKYFDVVVSGDTVARGKPFADPYLKCAQLLGINPSECLVIENAPLGIRSAKNAKMKCVALTTSLPKNYLRQADVVLDDLKALTKWIKNKY